NGPTGVFVPAGLSDDPTTFGLQFKEVLWTKDESFASSQLLALEIPGGTSGQTVGPPALFPAACTGGTTPDLDGDGLLDCWEDGTLWPDGLPGISFNGIYDGNVANRDVILCVDANGDRNFGPDECAHPLVKDVFIEIDYMQFHKPDPTAVPKVVTAFLNAPVANPASSPLTTGIRLHVLIDEQLTTTAGTPLHTDRIALFPCSPAAAAGDSDFDDLKSRFFGTSTERQSARALDAKRFAYHYAIFAHNQSGTNNTSSGCAEVFGNDFLVTLGSFPPAVTGHTGGVGSSDNHSGTLMHELGHNLGLRHGGIDNVNCKPNYPSVMSYSRQFSSPITGRPLDYSRALLGVPIVTQSGTTVIGLNEANLSESAGVGVFAGQIAFGPPVGIPLARATVFPSLPGAIGAVNWNRNASSTDTAVTTDINALTSVGCPTSLPANPEILEGFNDWANIQFNFRASVDFAAGAHGTIESASALGTLEMTHED